MIIRANAKINLTFGIVGKLNNGYHLIDSVMQSVSLCDIIEINKSPTLSVSFSNPDIDGRSSIAYKSAELFFEHTSVTDRADIKIESNIPTASGMGGGSSDAASVLIGLNELFGTKLSKSELCEIGVKVGADVPFCIIGGTARAQGIGEKITPIKQLGEYPIIIIKDSQKLSTAYMYGELDKKTTTGATAEEMVNAISIGDFKSICKCVSNDFSFVCDSHAEKKLLIGLGACASGLSGSGPSVFGIFDNYDTAIKAFEKLKQDGHNAYLAKTVNSGCIIE